MTGALPVKPILLLEQIAKLHGITSRRAQRAAGLRARRGFNQTWRGFTARRARRKMENSARARRYFRDNSIVLQY